MDTLIEILQRLPDRRFGAVVHLGAGAGALDGIAALDAERVVLIEGDPETASELRTASALVSSGPVLHLVEKVVAAQPGTVTWHRYNLRRLNGPLDAGGLVQWYPRLRETETLQREAAPLGEVLAELDLPAVTEDTRPHVLVMDLPGQEANLLATLDSAWLQRFTWIVLRSCTQVQADGWRPAREASQRLAAWSFARVASAGDDDPLWPTTLHRFDRERFACLQLSVQLADLQARIDADAEQLRTLQAGNNALEGDLAAARAEADHQARRTDALQAQHSQDLAAAEAARAEAQARAEQAEQEARQLQVRQEAESDRVRQEATAQLAQLAQLRAAHEAASQRAEDLDTALRKAQATCDDLHQLARDLTTQAESLARERDALAATSAALEVRCATVAQERDAAVRARAEDAARVEALQQQLAEARREAGTREGTLQAELDARDAQVLALGRERDGLATERAALQQQLAALAAQVQSVTKERDEQAHWNRENAQWAHKLKTEVDAVRAELAQAGQEAQAQQRRATTLEEERERSQQQLAALAAQVQAVSKERDEQAHWNRENAQWAHKLKTEVDQVRAELAQAQQAAQAQQQRATTLQEERDRTQQQVAERDARQHLIDAELLKAGAQIDLIKDILIREKNF